MNKTRIAARNRSAAAALGSVRAEGLKTSSKTQRHLKQYADGKITARALRSSVTGRYASRGKAK